MTSWRRIGDGVHGQNLVGRRVAHEIEPPAAALRVAPTFVVHALGILAKEQVLAPDVVALPQARPRQVRGAAARELVFVAEAAENTGDAHHQWAIPDAAASSMRRPVMNRSS